ncbi:hypothetical protein [Reyranella sp.]|uniref:hypothetical protein n=1 Tax=Reyranella sp. TaxID=1929291 RepID=UPI003BAC2192
MSFISGLYRPAASAAGLLVLIAAAAAATAQAGQPAAGRAPAPTPAAAREATPVEQVNKALNPGASDPDVPLPRADLSTARDTTAAALRAQIYGRQEQGGGVFGLRVPIPADHSR